MTLSRRSLITGLVSLVAAPAIVRAGILMPVKSMVMDLTEENLIRSGWLTLIHPLSDYNFSQLNHDLLGVPIYSNGGRYWPAPCSGVDVISETQRKSQADELEGITNVSQKS
jgi:hypothetical protein